MSRCKDCIHYEICEIMADQYGIAKVSPNLCGFYKITADVVEVRHGYWVSQEEAFRLERFDLAYACSVCGHCDWDSTESENFNYCPNCGAKMDGERNKK